MALNDRTKLGITVAVAVLLPGSHFCLAFAPMLFLVLLAGCSYTCVGLSGHPSAQRILLDGCRGGNPTYWIN